MNIPTFEQILSTPMTDTDKAQFMAEQEFIRQVDWAAKNLKVSPLNELWGHAA